jgi:DNA-binding MarR family transcriptional regulator
MTATATLTPTAELVLLIVREDGPITRQELLDRVDRHEATLDRAVEQLVESGKVAETRNPRDLREKVLDFADGTKD